MFSILLRIAFLLDWHGTLCTCQVDGAGPYFEVAVSPDDGSSAMGCSGVFTATAAGGRRAAASKSEDGINDAQRKQAGVEQLASVSMQTYLPPLIQPTTRERHRCVYIYTHAYFHDFLYLKLFSMSYQEARGRYKPPCRAVQCGRQGGAGDAGWLLVECSATDYCCW